MHNSAEPRLLPLGDRAIVVQFPDVIDPAVNDRVHQLSHHLLAAQAEPNVEAEIEFAIPAYNSLTLGFDPKVVGRNSFIAWIESEILAANRITVSADHESPIVRIPVCYGGEFGPDVDLVCQSNQISFDEMVDLHCRPIYRSYMSGFLPGFAYLGSVLPQLRTPRLETPRLKVSAGAVGIANEQTGVYPVDSPGGWSIIGRTPVQMIGESTDQPFLVSPGDRVQFFSIDVAEFNRQMGQG